LNGVLCREDLTPFTLSLLGDLSGHSSNFDRERGNNGIYAHSHWSQDEPSYMGLFEAASKLLNQPPKGMWIDIGSSVGRGTFELAAATGELAVGIDLNFSMLRIAQRIRHTRRVQYSLRRVGLAFDVHDFPIATELSDQVSFWCADVAILPFADATFAGSICMNMLDCVASPLGLLLEMGRVTAPDSESILCTPFDWAAGATAPAAWIGGHSQRSPSEGSSLLELRRILSKVNDTGVDTGLHIEAEIDKIKWRLRTHERSVTEYEVYLARLRHKP
jgi:SAM-dependent methyltransferase